MQLLKAIWYEINKAIKSGNSIASSFIFSSMSISIFVYLGSEFLLNLTILSYVSSLIMFFNSLIVIPYIFAKDVKDGTIAQLLIFGLSKEKYFLVKFLIHQIFCIIPCLITIMLLFSYFNYQQVFVYFLPFFLLGLNLTSITILTASFTISSETGILISIISSLPLMLTSIIITLIIVTGGEEQISLLYLLLGMFLINFALSIVTTNVAIEENIIG